MLSGEQRYLIQSAGFGKTTHQVHVLDGLPRGPLDDIVKGGGNHEPPGPLVDGQADIAKI
jgi:hypothetical protein